MWGKIFTKNYRPCKVCDKFHVWSWDWYGLLGYCNMLTNMLATKRKIPKISIKIWFLSLQLKTLLQPASLATISYQLNCTKDPKIPTITILYKSLVLLSMNQVSENPNITNSFHLVLVIQYIKLRIKVKVPWTVCISINKKEVRSIWPYNIRW